MAHLWCFNWVILKSSHSTMDHRMSSKANGTTWLGHMIWSLDPFWVEDIMEWWSCILVSHDILQQNYIFVPPIFGIVGHVHKMAEHVLKTLGSSFSCVLVFWGDVFTWSNFLSLTFFWIIISYSLINFENWQKIKFLCLVAFASHFTQIPNHADLCLFCWISLVGFFCWPFSGTLVH